MRDSLKSYGKAHLTVQLEISLIDEAREIAVLLAGGIGEGMTIILRAGLDALYVQKPLLRKVVESPHTQAITLRDNPWLVPKKKQGG